MSDCELKRCEQDGVVASSNNALKQDDAVASSDNALKQEGFAAELDEAFGHKGVAAESDEALEHEGFAAESDEALAAADPIAYINQPRWQASRLGLDRIKLLLDAMGRPQDALRFVHVAGTNGKGSTCAFISRILQEAGYRTGLFTSPYIIRFEERICVDGQIISPEDLRDVTVFVARAAEEVFRQTGDHPTEFELMTAVALEHFRRQGCDIAVLEVGLGGRFDSTNIIERPEVCVIARIGLDHTAILGDTLGKVAFEKAGIIKPGVPVVSYPQEPEAAKVIGEVAAENGTTVVCPDLGELRCGAVRWAGAGAYSRGARGDADNERRGATSLPVQRAVRSFSYRGTAFQTNLLGSYQPQNAALAIEAALQLREQGWEISDQALACGIAETIWPARFEVFSGCPSQASFGKTCAAVVVDGGHNPQGAAALCDSLKDVFPGVRPVFVSGVLADKDYRTMFAQVASLASAFVCLTPDNPRALSAEGLADELRELGFEGPIRVAGSMDEACELAFSLVDPDGVICAFGSLYSVGAFEESLARFWQE